MTYGISDPDKEFRWFFHGLCLAVVAGFLGFLFFGTPPKPAPKNDVVFGCYKAPDGPSFRLAAKGAIFGAEVPPLPFRLENAKIGIVLNIDDPINLKHTASGYSFVQTPGGSGRNYPFVVRSGDKAYYTHEERNLDMLHITADDGRGFEYRRQATHLCSGIDATA